MYAFIAHDQCTVVTISVQILKFSLPGLSCILERGDGGEVVW